MAETDVTPPETEITPPGEAVPPRDVRLADAVRVGLFGALVAIFVSAIGMVMSFQTRRVIEGITLGYILLGSIAALAGYIAAKPPTQLEGFAASRRGPRNVLAGLVAGAVTGSGLGAFLLFVGTVDIRSIFLNVSPALVKILSFGRGLAAGAVVLALAGAILGVIAGALHLLDDRWRRSIIAAVTWVLTFGVMDAVVRQISRGARITFLTDLLYTPTQALSVGGAVAIAVVGLAVSRASDRRRTTLTERFERLPAPRRRVAIIVLLLVALVVVTLLPIVLGRFLSQVLDVAGIFLVMALGLNIVVGFAGLLDLGYVAFFAVGAYTTAVLTSPISPAFTPELALLASIPFVMLAAALAGVVVGTPVLRMRGDYLAIVTLGFGEIARILFLSDWLTPMFGGARGIRQVPDVAIGPVELQGPQPFLYAVFILVVIAAYVAFSLQRSRMGRAWMAMREDESVAEAMGINIVRTKLAAFIVGAIIASLGGVLIAARTGSVFPHSFDIVVSITILVVVIVGGLASIPGVILGAVVLIGLPEVLREFGEFRFLIYGTLLIFMMLKRPEGFIPSKQRAAELHEEEVMQDVWLQAREEGSTEEDAG